MLPNSNNRCESIFLYNDVLSKVYNLIMKVLLVSSHKFDLQTIKNKTLNLNAENIEFQFVETVESIENSPHDITQFDAILIAQPGSQNDCFASLKAAVVANEPW